MCANKTDDDVSVDELRRAAENLGVQLASVEAIRPRRRQAAAELAVQIDSLREDSELRMQRSLVSMPPRARALPPGHELNSRHSRGDASRFRGLRRCR